MGGEHQRRSRVDRQLEERLADLAARLATEQPFVERRLGPMVDEPAEEAGRDRAPPAAVDDEVGRDPVEPGARLVAASGRGAPRR